MRNDIAVSRLVLVNIATDMSMAKCEAMRAYKKISTESNVDIPKPKDDKANARVPK